MDVITSPSNPAVRAARKLARPSSRARAGGRFLLEGPEGIRSALEVGHVPETLLATERAAARHAGLVNLARQRGAQVSLVAEPVLSALAATTTPQGLVAVLPSVVRPLEALPASPRLVCVLAEVRDPGNAGTVLRAADAFGADAVVTTAGSVDLQSPKAVRAAAGSLFHLPVTVEAELGPTVAELRRVGVQVLAADGAGPADLDNLDDTGDLARRTAWLFGNEAWGLPPQLAELADHRVAIPIHGRAESLNLATAAAVCLYAGAIAQRNPERPAGGAGSARPAAGNGIGHLGEIGN